MKKRNDVNNITNTSISLFNLEAKKLEKLNDA